MNREEAIEIIENSYPADAALPDKAEDGRQLLEAARALEWHNESDAVLIEYAKLCEEKDRIARERYRESLSSQT